MKGEDNGNENENILINKDNIEQLETDKIEEKYDIKEKIFYILKGISSIISSIIHLFGYSSIFNLGYTTIYLISFRRHYNQNIDFSYNYCFIPLMKLSFNFTAPIGGYIEDKLGEKKAIVLSNSFLCLSFIIMYFSRSIYIDYFLMVINGFGIAIGFNITRKNACSFFMNKKALVCGIINLFSYLLCLLLIIYNEGFIFNYKIEYFISKIIYFKEDVFINYQKLIIFKIVILLISCLGALLFYFKNDSEMTQTIQKHFKKYAKTFHKMHR